MKRFAFTTSVFRAAFIILLLESAPVTSAETAAHSAQGALEERLAEQPAIPELVIYAYEHNPSIQAAREGWRATVEQYRVATGYPDPQLMATYYPDPIETRFGPQDWNITLSQMIPFPGRLSKAGDVVRTEARIARLDLDKTVRDITVGIIESYYELYYIHKALEIADANRKILNELRKIGETAYGQDRSAFLDVVKAQSQTAQLGYDILLLKDLAETEKTRLNGLLNRPPRAPLGPIQEAPFDNLVYSLDELFQMAEIYREEIRMAELQIEKAENQIDLARYENLPEFRVGLFYGVIGDPDVPNPPPDAGDDAIGVQFGFSIPLWLGKNSGRVNRARAMADQNRAARTESVNETYTLIRNLYFRLQNARRLITLYRNELLPQAMTSLETAETWFREGQGSFSDFLETQSVVYNFQLALARARADHGKLLAGLERLVGKTVTLREEGISGDEE
ncbi:MAG: TolC family protein [Thermodesulfobacteriota bacterium]